MISAENPLEIVVGETPSAAIVWLHGLGADGYDFKPIIPELRLPRQLSIRFVFPHAPVRPVSINGGQEMRAWYDISGLDLSHGEDEKGLKESARILDALIEREIERGIAPARVLVAGFSQGGAVALYYLTRRASQVGGVMALSCYLPLMQKLGEELISTNIRVPIWMGHGTADTGVPLALGRQSRDRLKAFGFNVGWHEYPMPHSVAPAEVADISQWLQTQLSVG